MGRNGKIVRSLDTDYYRDVTPLWVRPCPIPGPLLEEVKLHLPRNQTFHWQTAAQQAECCAALSQGLKKAGRPISRFNEVWREKIEPQFNDAAYALASWDPQLRDWHPDSWAMHHASPFFRYRDRLIDCCKSWQAYDWERALNWHSTSKILAGKVRAARDGLSEAVLSLDQTYVLADSAMTLTLDSRDKLHKWLARSVWMDELVEWIEFPSRLAYSETIAGFMLADTLLRWRNYKNERPNINSPFSPYSIDSSISMPWEAIALFTAKATDKTVMGGELRTKVLGTWPNILRYKWPNSLT